MGMDSNLSHTPLKTSQDDSSPTSANVSPSQQSPSTQTPVPSPISVGATKEAGPSVSKVERHVEDGGEMERPPEQSMKHEQKRMSQRKDIPDIHPDAAKAGLQVAPSASQFPTIYDVKVPVLKDDEIESNLHQSFWTGARWLAELCKYILWQAHIKLKRVGGKIVRERISEKF